MTRTDYMKSLERLLAALSETERRDALDYYEEYFNDAGADHEADTIAELGSPEEVAQKILENQDFVPVEAVSAPERSASPNPKRRTRWKPLAACACLAVAFAAFAGVHHPSDPAATVKASTVATANALASTTENSTVYEIGLDCLKDLKLDLDIGSVTFVSQKNLESARIEVKNPDERFTTDDSFAPSGSWFKYKAPRGLTLSNSSKKDSFSLTIYLPEGFEMDKLDVSLDMGNLDLGNLHVKKLTAELDMGNCNANDFTADTAEIDLDMGNFDASVLHVRDLDVSSDMGNLKIGLLSDAEKVDLESDMGNVTLTVDGSLADYAVDAKADFGKLTIDGQTYSEKFSSRGSRELSLSASMGSVNLNFQN